MRVAVTLPSLPPGAPQREALEATVVGLRRRGVEIECFAEHDLVGRGPKPPAGATGVVESTPVLHYLRLPQRHRDEPFDAALYPLGRDAPVYQGTFWSLRRLPGLVWVLDPILHHLVLGDCAVHGKWGEYRSILEAAGVPEPAAICHTVASGWGTAALFGRHDLTASVLEGAAGVVGAWPALTSRLKRQLGREVGVVPLPLTSSKLPAASSAPGGRELPATGLRVVLLSVNPAYPRPALQAVRRLLRFRWTASVTICLPGPIYHAVYSEPARRLGIGDRVEWEFDAGWERMAEVAAGANVLFLLREDLVCGERLLVDAALAAGKLVFVPRLPLYADYPEGAVVALDVGEALAPELAGYLHALSASPELHAKICAAALDLASGQPRAADVAEALHRSLETVAAKGSPELQPIAGVAWRALARELRDKTIPAASRNDTQGLIEESLRELLRS